MRRDDGRRARYRRNPERYVEEQRRKAQELIDKAKEQRREQR